MNNYLRERGDCLTVYIDVLICVNMIIGYLILLSVKKFLHITVSVWRLLLGAAVSSVFSLAVFLPKLPFWASMLIKVAAAAASVAAAFGRCSFKLFLRRSSVFLLVSLLFGGVGALLCEFTSPDRLIIFNGVIYYSISPLVLVTASLISYALIRLMQLIAGRRESSTDFCGIEITSGGEKYCCKGKIDTGLNLREPFSGAPVIVCEKDIFNGRLSLKPEQSRVIPFESMGGSGVIFGFVPDGLKINEKEINRKVYIGLYDGRFNGEFRSLINTEVFE